VNENYLYLILWAAMGELYEINKNPFLALVARTISFVYCGFVFIDFFTKTPT